MKLSCTKSFWVQTVLLFATLLTAIGAKAQVSYTPLTFACPSDIVLNGVIITDPTGVVTSGTLRPRIYFRKNSDPWVVASGSMVSGTAVTSTWNFTMLAVEMGGLAVSDVVSYYVIAQNTGGTVFSNPATGMTATDVLTVLTAPTSPNTLTLGLPSLTGLVTARNTCVNTSVAQTASYTYSATTQGANQYKLTWSPAGPADVISFTALPSTAITATVPAGTAVDAYTGTLTVKNSATGCINTYTLALNVDSLPSAISGTPYVCLGATGTLASSPAGGTWTSATSSVVSVDAGGVITGVSVGTTNITYTAATGCKRSQSIPVNPPPNLITGTFTFCQGSTTTLSDLSPAGTWTSSDPTVATIDATTGIATGVAPGSTTITYTITTGCWRTVALSVNPAPAPIAGTSVICPGTTLSLTDATAAGTWSSSTIGVATVGATTGVVSGVAAGTTLVSYRLATGCKATTIISVNPAPPAITGTTSACLSSTSLLSNADGTGIWSSSSMPTASIDPTGLVTGSTPGTATITYTIGTGCYRTTAFTVNPLPAAIGGATAFCEGSTGALTNTSSGGTWSSFSAIAPVGPINGIVTGMGAGTANITYTLPTGCKRTVEVTINPLPATISGGSSVCVGSSITLASATTGGTWTGGTAGIATVGSATGIVTGIAAGTIRATYTISTGCKTTSVITINPLPAAIAGTLTQCASASTSLTNSTAGGTWTSSNTSIGTITPSTALVTAIAAGTTTISYTIGTGCSRTAVLTVNPLPAVITGSLIACAGTTTTLSSDSLGGVWTSSTVSVASVGFPTGIVTASAAGTATITYTMPNSCKRTAVVTVNALPGTIIGAASLCEGYTMTLSNLSAGGTWSSTNPAVASIDATTGIVTGIIPGTSVVSYIMPTGCYRATLITVNSSPAPITGTFTVCAGSITTLASATSGGSWTSSNSYAFAYPGGAVSGVAPGSAIITYTLPTGCMATAGVTINPIPEVITGTASLCAGTVTTLATTSTGGSWSSSNTAVAGITPLGEVSGASAGTATITYAFTGGCRRTTMVTVHPNPTAITGSLGVCTALTTTLHDAIGPGSWSSSNTSVAVIGTGTGIVMGAAPGTSTISYTTTAGCSTSAVVTVSLSPSGITGTLIMCSGQTTTLSDAVPGGTWTSGSLIASVDPAWGLVTGVTYGVATISYILPDGCRSTTIVTVNPLPANITGANTVCVGSVTTLNSATTGGTWSSSDVTTASPTVVTGYLSGIAVGSVTITYKLSTGCYKTKAMTVNPLPAAIAGTGPVCAGSTVTLTDSLLGGSWSSGNLAVAAVGSLSGAVMGVSGGTAVITYKLITTGCQQLKIITVNPVPASITGPANICVGSTSFLANAIAGGSWSSSDASIATVDPTGYVSGLVAGSATITYTMPTGCYRTLTVTVHPLPGAITGTTTVCPGATTTLGNTISGGTWTSSTPSVAAIGFSTGIVTGMTAGTTTITYALATGCIATTMVSVHIVPAPIGGAAEMCVGNSTTLSDISVGGTWISTSTVVASIGSASGIVTGVAAGTTTISYMQPSGCARTRIVTINPLPTPIEGELNTCISATTVLSDSMTGGAWSSSNPVVATAGPGTGVITGLTAGTTTITYTLTTGCRTTAEVTIHPTPAPITGMAGMCAGSTITLADATPGGIWSSAYPSIAVVNPTTGVVTGMATGIVTITYTIPENCRIFSHVTVNLSPGPITGSPGVCVGSTTDLNNYVPGGIWTSSNTTVATIGSASGLVSGLTVGTSAITYTIAGCMNSEVVTVNLAPGVITGPSQVCLGAKMTLANSVPGGVWSSSSGAIASISSSGEVTGIFTGIAIITYTIGLDCIATDTIHVAVSPPYADIVTHPKDSTMCVNTMFQNFGTYYPQPAGVTYTWSTTNAQIYQQSPDNQFLLVNYRHPGVAVVKLSTSLSSTGCVLTDSFVVHVGTDTSADHEVSYYNEKLICSDNTADAYQWGYDNNSNFDSTALPYGIHQDYNLPAPDFANNAYWVITTHGDCRQKSYYNMPTGVKSVNSTTNLDIKLFPNPADAKVNIEVVDANYRDNIAVRLTDITGKEISSTILKNGKATIDVSNLPAGTYLVALYKEGTKIGSRIVTRN